VNTKCNNPHILTIFQTKPKKLKIKTQKIPPKTFSFASKTLKNHRFHLSFTMLFAPIFTIFTTLPCHSERNEESCGCTDLFRI